MSFSLRPISVSSVRPLFLCFFLCLLLGLSWPSFAADLPLPLETLPNKTLTDVQNRAATEAVNGPVWGNAPDPKTLSVHQTFRGTVTADATLTKLAIFSDDGSDVLVDGVKVWSGKDQGQALPVLSQSLHELPVTLTPGSHSVEIDYSNIFYVPADASKGIPPDIDGCTLFEYGPAPVITVQTGSWQPNPAAVGQTIASTVTASVTNPYQAANGDSLSQNWTWATSGVYQSGDGTSGSFKTYTGTYSIGWTQGSASTQFSGIFSDAGYYIIQVVATLTYHDNTTGKDVGTYSGTGYIGGSASDLASSGSVSAQSAVKPKAAGTASGKGVPVVTVAKLQYAIGTSGFQDITTRLTEVAGTTVTFKAIPNPASASFAPGTLVWSGVKGTPSGDTYTVTFTTLNKSQQSIDDQIVTATVEAAQATARVLVDGVSIVASEYATGNQATLQRVKVTNSAGTNTYGSGTTMALTVSPVNGFNGKVTLDMDRFDSAKDIFGDSANAQDANGNTVHYVFYDPLQSPPASSHYSEPSDQPSYFSLDFSNSQPKIITTELWLDTVPGQVMSSGSYVATVFANFGSLRTGNELSMPIIVTPDTLAPASISNANSNSPNYAADASDYSRTTSPGPTGTFRKVQANFGSKSSTSAGYSAFQATVIPPAANPSSVSLVEAMNAGGTVAGDTLDIYTGGSAYDTSGAEYSPLDLGLSLGHTGVGGHYKITCNPASLFAGVTYQDGKGDTVTNVYVLPGQSVTMTLEVWGFPTSSGAIAQDTIVLKLSGPGLHGTVNGNDIQIPDYVKTDARSIQNWDYTKNIRFKRVTSIAQTLYGGGISPNVPPNAFPASGVVHDAGVYTTGAFVNAVTWTGIQLYDSQQGKLVPWNATDSSVTHINGSYPGSPYVLWNGGTIETVRTLGY